MISTCDGDDVLLQDVLQQVTRQVSQKAASGNFDLASPNLEQDLAKLVLSLIEFVRRLLENQALKRMERGSLSESEIDRLGTGLMRAQNQVHTIARQFGLEPQDLNLELGPLGRLM